MSRPRGIDWIGSARGFAFRGGRAALVVALLACSNALAISDQGTDRPSPDAESLVQLGEAAGELLVALTADATRTGPGQERAPKERVLSTGPLPLGWARELARKSPRLSTDFTIEVLAWEGIEARDVVGTLAVREGRVEVGITGMQLGRGQARGRLVIEPAATPPRLELEIQANDVNIDDLRRDDAEGLLADGIVDFDIQLAARGHSVAELASTMDGKVDLLLEKGTARRGDVGDAGRSSLFFLDLLSVLVPRGLDAVEIKCSIDRVSIESGIAREEVMLVETGQTLFSGSGTVDLRHERIDLTLTPQRTSRLFGVLLPPIRVSGTFASPKSELLPLRKLIELGNLRRLVTSPVISPILAMGGSDHGCARALRDAARP